MTWDEVINALECCLDINGARFKRCLSCKYRKDVDHLSWACETQKLFADVVSLLKAEPKRGRWEGWTGTHWTRKMNDYGDPEYTSHIVYHCSECGRRTVVQEAFCPTCGAEMGDSE